jgi:hypothetical protein
MRKHLHSVIRIEAYKLVERAAIVDKKTKIQDLYAFDRTLGAIVLNGDAGTKVLANDPFGLIMRSQRGTPCPIVTLLPVTRGKNDTRKRHRP